MVHILHSQTMKHLELETHQILRYQRNGIRKKRCCEGQLILMAQDLSAGLPDAK